MLDQFFVGNGFFFTPPPFSFSCFFYVILNSVKFSFWILKERLIFSATFLAIKGFIFLVNDYVYFKLMLGIGRITQTVVNIFRVFFLESFLLTPHLIIHSYFYCYNSSFLSHQIYIHYFTLCSLYKITQYFPHYQNYFFSFLFLTLL